MSIDALDVHLGDKRVGELCVADNGDYRFVYAGGAQLSDAISLILPVSDEPYDTQVLHPVFQQNLPEGRLREFVENAIRKTSARSLYSRFGDDLAVLYHTGRNQIGRIRVTPPGERPLPPGADTDNSLEQALTDAPANDVLTDYLQHYGLTSGVSGVQQKVLADLRAEHLTLPFGRYLVKFEGERSHFGIAVNERFCLRAAELAGLQVPRSHLSEDGRRLVVHRFDYDPDSGAPLGFEEACALAGLPNAGKYNGDYGDVVKVISAHVSPTHLARMRATFFRSLLLSLAVENGDAHLKNFGVLYRNMSAINIAPVYDIVTTTAYIPRDKPALTFLGKLDWPDHRAIREFGKKIGLRPTEIKEATEHVIDGTRQALDELRDYCAAHPAMAPVHAKLADIWTRGLSRLEPRTRQAPGLQTLRSGNALNADPDPSKPASPSGGEPKAAGETPEAAVIVGEEPEAGPPSAL